MNRALIVAIREVRTYLQDKADLAFSLLLPIAIFSLMYLAFGGETTFHGTAHVVNEDENGYYSTQLLEQLHDFENLDVELLSTEEANAKLNRSDLVMVLYIPEDFSTSITSGEPVSLIFKQRGNGGDEGQIVASMVRAVAEEINREFQVYGQVNEALVGSGVAPERVEITVQELLAQEGEQPILGVEEETVGSSLDLANLFLPGVVTMFVLFAITLSASAIVKDRKLGTLERLMTTRLSVGQLFLGKFLAGVSRGFVQTLILLVLAYIVFQLFTPLTFVECLVISLVFAAAASAIGLVIASITRGEDGAVWLAVLFTMATTMLGGTFFVISEGSVLYTISRFSINTYANEAFRTVMVQGGSLADVGLELGVLVGVMLVGLVLSRILFKAIQGGR